MDKKGVIIDDETMERLREISVRKGRNLEELINNYIKIIDMGRQAVVGNYKPDTTKMSPSLAALCGIAGKVPDDYDWRKDVEDELYQEYMELE